jgi:hypothetical protein
MDKNRTIAEIFIANGINLRREIVPRNRKCSGASEKGFWYDVFVYAVFLIKMSPIGSDLYGSKTVNVLEHGKGELDKSLLHPIAKIVLPQNRTKLPEE